MMPSAVLAALAWAAAAPAALPDPSGDYLFEGSCPTLTSGYRGRLTIRPDGAFHALTWSIDGTTLTGRGLMSGRRMAVEFRDDGGGGGLMEMRRRGRNWRGAWAFFGFNEVCTETWTAERALPL